MSPEEKAQAASVRRHSRGRNRLWREGTASRVGNGGRSVKLTEQDTYGFPPGMPDRLGGRPGTRMWW